MNRIAAPELKEMLSGNGLYAIIDIRDLGDYHLGHITGATSLPRAELELQASTLLPYKNVKVVLYGNPPQQQEAAEMLESLGYSDVSILENGFTGWKDAGFEVVEGSSIPAKEYAERTMVTKGVPGITVEEYIERRRRGELFYCIDPRTEEEFNTRHLPGAYGVPGGEIPFEIADIFRVKEATLLVCCAGRPRGILGAALLQMMGYKNTCFLKGGLAAWRLAGERDELGSVQPKPAPSAASIATGVEFTENLAWQEHVRFLSPEDVKARLGRNEAVYILDARLPGEYARSHIEHSISLPAGQVISVETVVSIKNATLVTVSEDRARAIISAYRLRDMGYTNTYALDGGIKAWKEKGFPLASGKVARPAIPALEAARKQAIIITASELREKLGARKRPLVLDVRGIGAFGTSHIPGARWVSRSYLLTDIGKEVPDKKTKLAVYCSDGQISTLAAISLNDLGYCDVAVLQGGFDGWRKAGNPVEEGLGDYASLEEVAIAEVGLNKRGPYGYSRERQQRYLAEEEALDSKYRKQA